MVSSSGISSLTFTRDGEALYLHSSSEIQRISLAAHKVTTTHCYLNLPVGARNDDAAASGEAAATATVAAEAVGEIEGKVQGAEGQHETQTAAVMVNGNANADSKESSVADKVRHSNYL